MKNKPTSRLLRIASWDFLITSAILSLLTAFLLFYYTRTIIDSELEEELQTQLSFIEINIKQDKNPVSIEPFISIKKASNEQPTRIKDTLMYDPRQNEIEEFREISKTVYHDNQFFQIKIRAMVLASEAIILGVVLSLLLILGTASLILFYINRSRNEKLWKPFFTSLDQLSHFSLDTKEAIEFDTTRIEEFNTLNTSLNTLVSKIKSDYNTLKQFTEDVSHEAQTPLAIMQAKIETITNQNDISDKLYEELSSIQKNIKRLAQLNKRLVLLAKIDNDQFSKSEKINLQNLLKERIEDFGELTAHSFKLEIKDEVYVKADRYLIEILIDNLLSNAIKYSAPQSNIHVKATRKLLQISNAGETALQNPNQIFKRFYRENSSNKATGLGLSIVGKICDYYVFTCTYDFDIVEKKHIFCVSLK